MNLVSGLCIGCGRTLDEIARWGGMSIGEREAIMRELPARQVRDKSAADPSTNLG